MLGCNKLDQLPQFDITYNQEVVIESSAIVDLPFNIYTPDIDSNFELTFKNNNIHRDLIEYIELTSQSLEIKSPSSGYFNFLKSIEIFIFRRKSTRSKDGLERSYPLEFWKPY